MYNIGFKIKELREKNKMSQFELSDSLNIGRQSMSHYETGKRAVPLEILEKLVKIFDIPIESFFSSNVEGFYSIEKKSEIKAIPIVSNDSVILEKWEEEDVLSYITLPEEICPKCSFGTIIKGDSMENKISDGEIILVQKKGELCNGEIGIFRYKGKLYCKKYRYSDLTKEVTLKSLNEKYNPIIIDLKGETDFKVIGKVVGAYDYNF